MSEPIKLSSRLHYQFTDHPLSAHVISRMKYFKAAEVREFLEGAALEAERLERENAELRNDLQRVDYAYRELTAACEIAKVTCSPKGLSVLSAALAKGLGAITQPATAMDKLRDIETLCLRHNNPAVVTSTHKLASDVLNILREDT